MKLKLRSEGTPINSEIYAESLAGTDGSAKAERAITLGEADPEASGDLSDEGYVTGTAMHQISEVGSRVSRWSGSRP